MPSASSKSEKPASTEAVDPLKQAIVIIGHKIRNLEKRKSKLDSYKESIDSLTKGQIEAVAKYDEVVHQLELSKEYVKQFKVISDENDKEKKKQAKKDAQDKYLLEISKIKQILEIQDVLQSIKTENVRQDFLEGQNGAVKLTEADFKVLDDLSTEILPKRFSDDGTRFENDQFQKAAENFITIVDGKPKKLAGSTGTKLKELIISIHTSGYFDRPADEKASAPQDLNTVKNEEEFTDTKEMISNIIVPTQTSTEGNHLSIQNSGPVQNIIPGNHIMPGAQPAMIPPNQHPILPPNVTNIVPTPVSQVESGFFNAQGFKPPTAPNAPPSNQNNRQINDVIQNVAGKFSFLQESELDIGELNSVVITGNPNLAAPQMPGTTPIPTQTFTNQNFNNQTGNAPTYPTNYPPPQPPPTYQTFVPAFPGFVPPNASTVQNSTVSHSVSNPTTIAPVSNSINQNLSNSNSTNVEKQDNEKPDWSQTESTNWADDWVETSEWNSVNQTQSEGFRDSQNNPGSGGGPNYYQNQNGYQGRNNEYSTGKGSDLRDNNSSFKERGEYNNRDRDSYGGGFKRGLSNRGPGMKPGPGDRGDKSQMQIPRNNLGGGPRISRNINNNRQPGGNRGGGPPNFPRQPPNPTAPVGPK
ncbi:GPI-anchored protein p137, putative [Pediculus humanus corporis]|uniref:GPI-anchored protein p137, putative n=1 Tax=Pediculus humanus subsp. corporis TaxID=121224 RepID=E0VCJ2_PEDHC|nr:GPI-anchored protein p137, putative [Pediculus humanus corporis]EEB11098.1 GPI-anchored protein p137, putative [Pediculus humanus corporis]